MAALPGSAGCFSRNAHWDVHLRQSVQTPLQSRLVRCQAQRNAEPPQKADARGIFEMSPPCCEATLLDARCWSRTFLILLFNFLLRSLTLETILTSLVVPHDR